MQGFKLKQRVVFGYHFKVRLDDMVPLFPKFSFCDEVMTVNSIVQARKVSNSLNTANFILLRPG